MYELKRKNIMSFKKISNTPNHYAWGDYDSISNFTNQKPSGEPEAELWLGTHESNPSKLEDGTSLDSIVNLPFLVKLLAAKQPLSIQVHPNKAQAEIGFDVETIKGLNLDNASRNYRDNNHKPEMIIALEDNFKALCGFQKSSLVLRTVNILKLNVKGKHVRTFNRLSDMLLESTGKGYKKIVKKILKRKFGKKLVRAIESALLRTNNVNLIEIRNLKFIAKHYPHDIGLAVALLLNHVSLDKGQVLYLPAGNVHAYLKGFGLEVMANSDNVIRAGLTPKNIDVEELLKISDFSVLDEPLLQGEVFEYGRRWSPISDFNVTEIDNGNIEVNVQGKPTIVVAEENSTVKLSDTLHHMNKGECAIILDEHLVTLKGKLYFIN